MDVLPSSEFRKRYASLTRTTAVTVNGHTIGYWHPGVPANDAIDVGGAPETRPVGLRPQDEHPRVMTNAIAGEGPARGVRAFAEFRPVPKPGGKR